MGHDRSSGEEVMKCVACINLHMNQNEDAFTIVDGHAFCLPHLVIWTAYRERCRDNRIELRPFIRYVEQLSDR
jgi:hypothetical protein